MSRGVGLRAQVSFGEIFIIKGVGAFEESGYDGDTAMRYASSRRRPIHARSCMCMSGALVVVSRHAPLSPGCGVPA